MTISKHPIERAMDRYGVELTPLDLSIIGREIRAGRTVRLGTCPKRGTQTHMIKYKDTVMKVIYCPTSELVVTFYEGSMKLSKSGSGRRKNGKMKKKGRRNYGKSY